jgi:hypothetical protein
MLTSKPAALQALIQYLATSQSFSQLISKWGVFFGMEKNLALHAMVQIFRARYLTSSVRDVRTQV